MANGDEKNLCPTCHSEVSETPLDVREQGADEPGETVQIETPQGTKEVRTSTSGAIPQWTDDPGLTFRGFNGEDFVGPMKVRGIHIQEIQDARRAEEEEVGLGDDLKTKFSDIEEGSHVRGTHLIELRESTEKILNAGGRTLQEYFNLDVEENEVDPGPNDTDYEEEKKEEWTDVARGLAYINSEGGTVTEFELPDGTTEQSPTFPAGVHIRLIHLEDLRHPVPLGWREFWSKSQLRITAELPGDHIGVVGKIFSQPIGLRRSDNGLIEAEETVVTQSGPGGQLPEEQDEVTFTALLANINPFTGISTTTEGNSVFVNQFPRSFPSADEYDIYPSDGGNRYAVGINEESQDTTFETNPENYELAYPAPINPNDPESEEQGERTWIVSGEVEATTESVDKAAFVFFKQGCPFQVGFREAGQGRAEISAKAEIIPLEGEGVEILKEDAQTLLLEVEASAGGDVVKEEDGTRGSASGEIAVRHAWQDGFLPDFYIFPQANRRLLVRKNTHFKFFIEVEAEKSVTKNSVVSESIEAGSLNVSYTLDADTDSSPGFHEDADVSFNEDVEQGRDGGVSNDLTMTLSFQSPDFSDPFVQFIFVFSDISRGFSGTTVQAPFDGQTFTFERQERQSNPGTYIGSAQTVLLGKGESIAAGEPNGRYDIAINVDDLLAASKQLEIDTDVSSPKLSGYVSQKKEDPETSEIVANEDGSLTVFRDMQITLSASANGGGHGKIDHESTGGPPECNLVVTTTGPPGGSTEAEITARARINALRINGNDKRVQDFEE